MQTNVTPAGLPVDIIGVPTAVRQTTVCEKRSIDTKQSSYFLLYYKNCQTNVDPSAVDRRSDDGVDCPKKSQGAAIAATSLGYSCSPASTDSLMHSSSFTTWPKGQRE